MTLKVPRRTKKQKMKKDANVSIIQAVIVINTFVLFNFFFTLERSKVLRLFSHVRIKKKT